MKLISKTALTLATAAIAVPAAAQTKTDQAQQQQPKIVPSKGALKALTELQDAVQKNDVASIPAKVAAAEAAATTKEDKYLVARLQLQAAVAAKDNAATVAAIDKISASNYLDAAQVSKLYTGLGGTLFNDKQYAQAATAYQKALALDPRNAEAAAMVGDALSAAGRKGEAAAAYQRLIEASVASGKKPDESLMRQAVAAAYEAKSPSAVELARKWVEAYPGPQSWRNSIAIYRNLSRTDLQGTLDLLRLMQAVGALSDPADYSLFARAAFEQNNFDEARAVLDAGVAAKVVSPSNPEYSDIFAALKAKPRFSAADLATATKTAATGTALVHIGDRYLAMGEYAKAAELYRQALNKPGVDKPVANLHLGMALARSGDKAGAVAALNAVTGPQAEIAKFWLTYVNQKA